MQGHACFLDCDTRVHAPPFLAPFGKSGNQRRRAPQGDPPSDVNNELVDRLIFKMRLILRWRLRWRLRLKLGVCGCRVLATAVLGIWRHGCAADHEVHPRPATLCEKRVGDVIVDCFRSLSPACRRARYCDGDQTHTSEALLRVTCWPFVCFPAVCKHGAYGKTLLETM